MGLSEKREEAWFREQVRRAGGWTVKFAPILSGTPDRVVFMPGGRVFFVELKTDDGELSPIQRVWHSRAARLGTEVVVLHGRMQIAEWVRAVSHPA